MWLHAIILDVFWHIASEYKERADVKHFEHSVHVSQWYGYTLPCMTFWPQLNPPGVALKQAGTPVQLAVRSGASAQGWVLVQTSSACADLPGTDWNQLNVCWCECFCTNFCWETSVFCLIGTPSTNMGFWAGTRLNQRHSEKLTG